MAEYIDIPFISDMAEPVEDKSKSDKIAEQLKINGGA